MKRMASVIASVAVALLAWACQAPDLGCNYRLTVTWQERGSVSEPVPLSTARVFVFYADSEKWEVTSIENARNGVATAVGDSLRTINYDMELQTTGAGNNVFEMQFTEQPVMLLVVDEKYPMWATGNANVVAGLPVMNVSIQFTPLDWNERTELPVVKAPWKFYGYDKVEIPIDTELYINPIIWREGAGNSDIMTSARCYAYYDFSKTNSGRVTSWEQASSGLAERLEAPEGTEDTGDTGDAEDTEEIYVEHGYDTSGRWVYGDDNGMLSMDIYGFFESIMIVVYNEVSGDSQDRIYAYSYLDLSSNPVRDTLDLLVDMRTASDSWTRGTWNIAVERASSDTDVGTGEM